MGKRKPISRQNRSERLQSTSRNFDPVNSSSESTPSNESNISAQFKIPASKQNGIDVRRRRRKRRASEIVYQNGTRTRYLGEERFHKHFASPTCTLIYGNHPSTSFHPSKQSTPGVFQLRGHPEGHEDRASTFPAESSKFQMNSKPCLHTPIPFNDPSSHYVQIKRCSGNTFQSEKQVYSSPASTSKSAASSSSGRAVLNFIRHSKIPPNMDRSLASSTTSSRGKSYSRSLSFRAAHSTPKDHSALEEMGHVGLTTQNISQASVCPFPTFRISPIETTSEMSNSPCSITLPSILKDPPERDISPCSTMAEAGSMESIQRDTNGLSRENSQNSPEPIFPVPANSPESVCQSVSILRDKNGSFRENSQHSPERIHPVPLNSSESQISTNESLDSDNGAKNIKYLVNLISDLFPFKGNSTHPKSDSEENGQNNFPLKNENSLKTFMFPYSKRTQKDYSALLEMGHIGIITQNATQAFMHPFPTLRSSPIETTSQMTNSPCSIALPSIHPPAPPERSISPCSTMAEAGSMESILRDTNGSSRKNSQHYSAPIFLVSPNSSESQISTNESLDGDSGTKNMKYFVNPNPYCFFFKGNSTHPKSASEENGQKNSLKNESTFKTYMFPVTRQCSSQLQIHPSPANTSTSPLHESKHIENAVGCIKQIVLYPDELYPLPEVRLPGSSKAAKAFLEEKGRSDSMIYRYPEEHAGESLATLNPIKTQSSSDQRYYIENVAESLRQSYISRSMTPTDASEMPLPSNKPDSKQSTRGRNKTKKESKLISCFFDCFRSSSPRQEGHI